MKLPGTALIATVYNEAATIGEWLTALAAQTCWPEEFVIVDGGSRDATVARISAQVWPAGFPAPKIIVQPCNIAAGRNLAINNCRAEIIASTDAGSLPAPDWFGEISRPLIEKTAVQVVAGECVTLARNPFQQRLALYLQTPAGISSENCMPSSRNVAFRRSAWAAVGGYPEWLTLTAEDALFNENLRAAGLAFYYQPAAIVGWEPRPNMKAYLKMMYSYGYGSAEAGLAARHYRRWLLSTLVPPLILFSPHPLKDAGFRYGRNAATAFGWLVGKIRGRRPPAGWKYINGIWISPETQQQTVAVS
jgi:glycosyltransferase involved in cell wall biosynthesis